MGSDDRSVGHDLQRHVRERTGHLGKSNEYDNGRAADGEKSKRNFRVHAGIRREEHRVADYRYGWNHYPMDFLRSWGHFETGIVTRPEADQPAAIVTLTALIQNELQSEQLSFEIQVELKEAGKLSAYYPFDETYQNAAGDQTDAQVTGDRINNTGGAVPFVEVSKGRLLRSMVNPDCRLERA